MDSIGISSDCMRGSTRILQGLKVILHDFYNDFSRDFTGLYVDFIGMRIRVLEDFYRTSSIILKSFL